MWRNRSRPNPIIPEVAADFRDGDGCGRGTRTSGANDGSGSGSRESGRAGGDTGSPAGWGRGRCGTAGRQRSRRNGPTGNAHAAAASARVVRGPRGGSGQQAGGHPVAPLSPQNPLAGPLPPPVEVPRVSIPQQIRAHAQNALDQLKGIAAATSRTRTLPGR